MTKSEEIFNRGKELIPGGVNSPVRSFSSVGGNPPFIKKAKGKYIWDVDGNRYYDFLSSWGPLILGNQNPKVKKYVKKAINRGFSYGAPTPSEIELANLVVDSVPSIEMVRFVNSGTEAVMSALRLARGYTGRDIIVKFDGCYHGHTDSMLVSAGSGMASKPSSSGVPKEFLEKTISVPFNNIEAVKEVFKLHKPAAVIVEPIPGNMGCVPAKEDYLQFLRDITKENETLLIFDEVISGFRASLGGAQELFGITPDITTLGKIIGGGFPVGAYGASRKIMSYVSPIGDVYQAGTLSGNPVAMAAGIGNLKELRKPGFYDKLNSNALVFTNRLKELTMDLPVTINSAGSVFTIFFTKDIVLDYETALKGNKTQFNKFFHKLLENGIYFPPSPFECGFISSIMSIKELLKLASKFDQIIREVLNENII